MPYFQCFIHGQDFPGLLADIPGQTIGFYTNRYIEAVDPQQAEDKVLELLRREKKLQLSANAPGCENARVIIEEIVEVDSMPEQVAGFVFYVEDSKEEKRSGN